MGIQRQRLRPVIWPLLNPDNGFLYCHPVRTGAGEADPAGEVDRVLRGAAAIRRNAFLSFGPPEGGGWERDIALLGERFGEERRIGGIEIRRDPRQGTSVKDMAAVLRKAFPHACLFVPAGEEDAADSRTGLVLEADQIQPFGSRAAERCLAVHADPDDAELACFAAIHHTALLLCGDEKKANRPCHAGHRFRVTELVMDDTDRKKGTVRFTVTADNAGTVPCYRGAAFRLRLCGSGVEDERVYPLPLKAADLTPGLSETVALEADVTGLAPGEYDVQAGLFMEDTGDPVSMGIEGRISDGYYEGRLILELD